MCSGSSDGDFKDMPLYEVHHSDEETKCKMCFRPAQDPSVGLKLGPLFKFGKYQAHLYCLMFSSGLEQSGEDEEDIKGFLISDISKECRRGSFLKCIYCKQTYATVGCIGKGCRKTYHLPCGIENGSLQQFFGEFSSYCSVHRPVQRPSKMRLGHGGECGVCLEVLEEVPGKEVLWTPCCGGWFHRSCVERMADVAGCHFFKCPLCNNREEFSQEMQEFGIYLPDQDAGWETGSAFDDQLQRHGTCDADDCVCPGGKEYDVDDTDWEIVLCCCCGSQGIHVKCGNLTKLRWKCSLCKEVLAGMQNKPVSVFTRVKRGNGSNQFQKNILDHLSFKVIDRSIFRKDEVKISLFKNNQNSSEAALATFVINPAPVCQLPLPVKVSKVETTVKSSNEQRKSLEDCPIIEHTRFLVGSSPIPKLVSEKTFPVQPDLRKNMKAESPHKDLSSKKRPLLPILQHQSSICTSTPISSARLSKKRKLSLSPPATHHSSSLEHFKDQTLTIPPGQSSILNFFKYSVQGEGRVADKSPEKSVNINVVDFYGEAGNKSLVNTEQFSCSLCNKTKFKSKKSWQAHITNVHKDLSVRFFDGRRSSIKGLGLNTSSVQCGKCENVFKTLTLLKGHLDYHHIEEEASNDVQNDTLSDFDKTKESNSCDSSEKTYRNNKNPVKNISQHTHKASRFSHTGPQLECYICQEPVLMGADYECHLNLVHSDEPSRNELDDAESDVVILDDDDSLFKLESNNEISCYLCAEAVMLGDDYRCHLKFSHGVDDEKIETIISKFGST